MTRHMTRQQLHKLARQAYQQHAQRFDLDDRPALALSCQCAIIFCPDCGRIHLHAKRDGWRASHCAGPSYYVRLVAKVNAPYPGHQAREFNGVRGFRGTRLATEVQG